MGHDSGNRLIIEVPRNGNFDVVLRLIAEALKSPGGGTDNTKLEAIINMLRPLADVPAQLGFLKEEISIIHGLLAEGTENGAVLTAVNNLNGKVDEFMATQEERLRGVKAKLDAIQAGVDKIQEQLATLKANNPELEDEIAAIEETANAIDTDVNPVVAPPVEPTP